MKGRTVLVTRRKEQAADLAAAINERGGRVLYAPMIAIAPPLSWEACDTALARLQTYDAVVFASVNAVEMFLRRGEEQRVAPSLFHSCSLYAVGPSTAAALSARGFFPEKLPASPSAAGLLAAMRGRLLEGTRILLPRSEQGRDELLEGLRARGALVDAVDVYRTVRPAPGALAGVLHELEKLSIDVVIFASPSAVRNFLSLLPPDLLQRVTTQLPAVAIGPTTAEALRSSGWNKMAVARTSTAGGLADAVVDYFQLLENA